MNNRHMSCRTPRPTPQCLCQQLRLLWSQHVYRTRFFIISTAAELPDLPYVTKWLLQNPGDFAAALCPFYGKSRADRFKQLLTEHLNIAGELVNAAKNGETAKADALRRQWYDNADDIAAFLSKINPFWNCCRWRELMHDHLRMTEREATLRLAGQYPEDIAEFHQIEAEALEMADEMAQGIIRQFRLC